jgi:hypothetical protein
VLVVAGHRCLEAFVVGVLVMSTTSDSLAPSRLRARDLVRASAAIGSGAHSRSRRVRDFVLILSSSEVSSGMHSHSQRVLTVLLSDVGSSMRPRKRIFGDIVVLSSLGSDGRSPRRVRDFDLDLGSSDISFKVRSLRDRDFDLMLGSFDVGSVVCTLGFKVRSLRVRDFDLMLGSFDVGSVACTLGINVRSLRVRDFDLMLGSFDVGSVVCTLGFKVRSLRVRDFDLMLGSFDVGSVLCTRKRRLGDLVLDLTSLDVGSEVRPRRRDLLLDSSSFACSPERSPGVREFANFKVRSLRVRDFVWDSNKLPESTISLTTTPVSSNKMLLAAFAIRFASMGLDAAIILKSSTILSESATGVGGGLHCLGGGLNSHSVMSEVVLVSQLDSGRIVPPLEGLNLVMTSFPPLGVVTRLFAIRSSSSRVINVPLSSKLE